VLEGSMPKKEKVHSLFLNVFFFFFYGSKSLCLVTIEYILFILNCKLYKFTCIHFTFCVHFAVPIEEVAGDRSYKKIILFVVHLVCFPSLWFEVHPWHAFDVFDILSKRMVYQEQKYPKVISYSIFSPFFNFYF
jgi:hypothetical protein